MALTRTREFRGTERYALVERIGVGSMGAVYRVYDRERETQVALKHLRGLGAHAIYRFKREFRALADVDHRNIVSLYELVSDQSEWFITMELIDGVDLLEYVRSGMDSRLGTAPVIPLHAFRDPEVQTTTADTIVGLSQLAAAGTTARAAPARIAPALTDDEQLGRLRRALGQLVDGVAALHGLGILHRDLKPSNVLVDRDGRAVVLDFGVVTDLTEVDEEATRVAGTPAYMAPEQGTGEPLTEASDWYSVGVILYEALTGRRPFHGTPHEVLAAKRKGDPVAPRELAPQLPEDLDRLCMTLLARAPHHRPGAAEILDALGRPRAAAALATQTMVGRELLIGRDHELDILRDVFAEVQRGRPRVVLIHGRSGVGKTALVRHFLTELEGREAAIVLRSRCFERESVPYKALDPLIDATVRHLLTLPEAQVATLLPEDIGALARLFPVLRRVDAVLTRAPREAAVGADLLGLRRRAFAAFRQLFERLAGQRPVILHIDDCQWGDLDSGALLAETFQAPMEAPLLLLAGFRSDEAGGPLVPRLLDLEAQRIDLHVGALGHADTLHLARTLVEHAGARASRAAAIARECGGNPFFATELARHLLEHESDRELAELTLDGLIASRLQRLSATAQKLAGTIAVAGLPIAQDIAFGVAGVRDGRAALRELRAGKLVRGRGARGSDHVEIYHDRIRDALLAMLDADELCAQHLRLAATLEATTVDAEVVAYHYERARQPALAAQHYVRAADDAGQALAFDRAASLLERALSLDAGGERESSILHERLGDARANAGHGAGAATAYLQAAADAPRGRALQLRARAAEQLLLAGRMPEGLESLRQVLAELGVRIPRSPRRTLAALAMQRARVRLRGLRFPERDETQISLEDRMVLDVYWTAATALGMTDLRAAQVFQCRHLRAALDLGEPSHVARALAVEGIFRSLGGAARKSEALQLIQRADELIGRSEETSVHTWVHAARAFVHYQIGDFAGSAAAADTALAAIDADSGRNWWERTSLELYRLWAVFQLGRLRAFNQRAGEMHERAQERGDLYASVTFSVGLPVMRWLAADEPAAGRSAMREAMALWPHTSYHLQHLWLFHGEVFVDLYTGDGTAALRRIDDELSRLRANFLLRVQIVRIETAYLDGRAALVAAEELPRAERGPLLRRVRRAARRIERERTPFGDAMAALLRAGIAALRGVPAEAEERLAAALQACEDCGLALYATAARYWLGTLRGAEGLAMRGAASAAMRAEGIARPEAMARLFVPGFAGDAPRLLSAPG